MNRLFAIGDIHGCFDSFRKLMEEKMQLTKSDRVVLLGDYIDRGAKSKQVIDYIISLKEKGFQIIPISGNHEQMLLDAFDEEELIFNWLLNGAVETMKSFGIDSIKDLDPNYLYFFRALPLFYEIDNYLFVHAGFNDELEDPFTDTYHMIWKCREKYSHPYFTNKTVVHGHCVIAATLCDERIKSRDRVINLDTGCVFSNYKGLGRLTALELNTRDVFYV